ncbi:unnamed protein product [Phaedon cochleariae]|uniref:H15 domain-containing protein n=1 Tax=Phaedon cochleariae TaxID=80249 RepID=A0A9P0GX55_PHACE|nr:unnamed protein product [Phaedon cochleariae]
MRKGSPHPRLLNEVMEAIAKLKELDGSTPKKISNQVETILTRKKKQLQRDAGQIKKALKHGVLSGLITRVKGKYKLGLAKRDYDVYKNLTPMVADGEIYREHKRRGGRRSRRRRRRRSRRGRRRRRGDLEEDSEDNVSELSVDTTSSLDTSIPEDRSRRRRRKGRRRGRGRSGRRGRRGRRHTEDGTKSAEKTSEDSKQPKKVERKSSNESVKSTESQQEYSRSKHDINRDPDENMDDLQDGVAHVNCDSPDCLCNIMQSEQNTHDNRKTK